MVRKSVLVSLAAAALPLSADAFTCGHNAALASRNPLGAGVRMCAQPGSEAAPVAMTKKSIVKKAVTLFSALSIGSAAAPIASRARDMPALPMDTALVAEASVTEAPAKEKAGPLKSIAIGGIAGAAGFGSVILLRKGLQKDTPSSPQEWADKKQKEWKMDTSGHWQKPHPERQAFAVNQSTAASAPSTPASNPVSSVGVRPNLDGLPLTPSATAAAAPAAAASSPQAAPPAKLELPKAKLEAAAVNAKQWSIGGASVPASTSATAGTQAPPPAKLELPKAKLEAKSINAKQWHVGASVPTPNAAAAPTPASAQPADATDGLSTDYVKKLEDLKRTSTATMERRVNNQ